MFTQRDLSVEQAKYLDRIREGLHRAPPVVRDEAADYARTLMQNGFPVIFDVSHLAWTSGVHANVLGAIAERPSAFYSVFRVPKRLGGSRRIAAPLPALATAQRWIHRHITSQIEHVESCHGFVKGRSIATNASPHARARVILKLDLVDFFESVERRSVYRLFRRFGYSKTVANLLAGLCTLGARLPQGASTSPGLANAAAFRMDLRLGGFCRKRGIAYTRYADDLTFSGPAVTQRKVKRTIESIVRKEGFTPNEAKARYLSPGQRQSVTGIVVNDGPNWPRPSRRWIRQEVHYLCRYGVDEHLRHRGIEATGYKEFIYGHVYALNVVRPDEAREVLEQLDSVEWPY